MSDTDILLDQTFQHMAGVYLAQRQAQAADYWAPRIISADLQQQAERQLACNLESLAVVDRLLAELQWADDRTH
jgi:hypothetical protein